LLLVLLTVFINYGTSRIYFQDLGQTIKYIGTCALFVAIQYSKFDFDTGVTMNTGVYWLLKMTSRKVANRYWRFGPQDHRTTGPQGLKSNTHITHSIRS
jgi:hypothetical protein